jgi:UDP-glucose-4-epimerase GalE
MSETPSTRLSAFDALRFAALLGESAAHMPRSILVVGGAGYIGSFTVDELARRGDSVAVFDNLLFGHRKAVHPNAAFLKGDLASDADLEALFSSRKFDAVVHFAALTSVGESVKEPLLYYRANVNNTVRLLGAMAKAGVKRIVFSSSAATYGIPDGTLDERHPQTPINPYGRTKLMVEEILRDTAAAGVLSAAALRYFNASGGDDDGRLGEDHTPETHLIPLVLGAALGSRPPVKIFGSDYPTPDGTCIRDYIHVRDLADAHLKALDFLFDAGKETFEGFNVGTGAGTSVREVLKTVEAVSDRPVPCEEAPRREGDPPVLVAAPGKIERMLGWKAKRSDIKEIVGSALAFMERHPRGYDG